MTSPLSWIATRGLEPGFVLDKLDLAPSSHVPGARHGEGATVAGAALNAWFLVIFGHTDDPLFAEERFKRLSRRGQLLAVRRNATTASCDYWFAGERIWAVSHDGSHPTQLLVEGVDLPPKLSYLRAAARSAFEKGESALAPMQLVPLLLAEDETGFRADGTLPGIVQLGTLAPAAEVALMPPPPAPKPFWKFW
jgi:hypothetical protein